MNSDEDNTRVWGRTWIHRTIIRSHRTPSASICDLILFVAIARIVIVIVVVVYISAAIVFIVMVNVVVLAQINAGTQLCTQDSLCARLRYSAGKLQSDGPAVCYNSKDADARMGVAHKKGPPPLSQVV